MERKFQIAYVKEGIMRSSRQGAMILSGGKNKNVEVIIEKKGKKLIFSVDNMEVISITRDINFTTFGFFVEGNNVLKVDEVSVEQVERE